MEFSKLSDFLKENVNKDGEIHLGNEQVDLIIVWLAELDHALEKENQ